MSHVNAKLHRIRFLVSVRLSLCPFRWSLTLSNRDSDWRVSAAVNHVSETIRTVETKTETKLKQMKWRFISAVAHLK